MSKTKGLLFLFIVVVLPLIVWMILRTGEHHVVRLEIIGPRSVATAGSTDTIFHTVYDAYPDFRFPTQRGDTLTWDSLRGKVFIADVFFSTCKGPCPKLSASMARLVELTEREPDIKFLSISVDPANDSVPRLKEYADLYGADPNRWYFITGEKDKLYKLAMEAFYFKAAVLDSAGFPILVHDEEFRLIDKEGRIRKGNHFINGTQQADIALCFDEIKLLLNEYRTGK